MMLDAWGLFAESGLKKTEWIFVFFLKIYENDVF